MKIYINSPVFQKFLFQSTRRKTSSIITPVSQSVSVRNSNRVERPIETRSLSVQRDTKQEPTTGKFFADEDIHEKILRDIQQGHNQESIRKLEQLPASKQQYLLLAVAHRNLFQNERAKMWLLKAIKEFHCDDAYIQLGIMEMKQARYNEAIKLFDQVKGGDLYKARCLTALKLHKQAIDIYDKHDELSLNDRVRHAIAIYKNGQLESALLKIEQLLQLDSEYSEGLLTKGIILFKKKLYSESVMVLECAVQVSNSSLTTARSLYYMIKCRVSQRDYYAAWAQLQRALGLKRSFRFMAKVSRQLFIVNSFVQGTMCLMKRQYQRGLDYLQECKSTKFLSTHLPLHLAYAQFCLSDYRAALVHYEQVKDNQPTIYNSLLCKALLAKPQDALLLLDQALLIYHRMEPFIYKAIALIQLNGLQSLKAIELNIEQAFKAPGKQSNVYFIRAILKAIKKRYTSAIKDIDKAVDKSEDNIPDHFFLRGILHGQAMRLKQAVKDFSTTLHFNPQFQQAYLERAKCYQILGDVTNSQQDLQKYCLGKNNDAHFWTGAILFHNNQYEEALSQIELCSGHVMTRLKCLLKMQKIDKAVELSLQLDPGCDRSMIQFIHHTIELSQKKVPEDKAKIQLMEPITIFGEIFKEQDYRLMRGAGLIYLRKPKESIEEFQFLERFWIQVQKERSASITDKSVETEQSEELQNEMILKSERIVQHIIAVKYNLIIVYLMTKQYLTAQQKVREIRQQIGNIFSEELDYLESTIVNQIEKKSSGSFPRILSFLMNDKSIFNYFPTLRIPLLNNTYFDCKLSLNLPDVQPPNICPIFDKNCLLKIKYSMIENKPEAPWLSRVKNNVIFTQNILDQTIDLTTDEDVPKKKQPFEIDENVQKKLERIMKKQ